MDIQATIERVEKLQIPEKIKITLLWVVENFEVVNWMMEAQSIPPERFKELYDLSYEEEDPLLYLTILYTEMRLCLENGGKEAMAGIEKQGEN